MTVMCSFFVHVQSSASVSLDSNFHVIRSVCDKWKNFDFADPAITTSPSEDEEDNAEFYDAQESDTFTLSIPGVATSNSISHTRDRTDSQGSDDGSSSEGDPTPLPVSDSTGAESFLIVTDSTAAQIPSPVATTDDLDNVNECYFFNHLNYLQNKINLFFGFLFYRLGKPTMAVAAPG